MNGKPEFKAAFALLAGVALCTIVTCFYVVNYQANYIKIMMGIDHESSTESQNTYNSEKLCQYECDPETESKRLRILTNCPNNDEWMKQFVSSVRQNPSNSKSKKTITSIYVGCNKGMDAANTFNALKNDDQPFDIKKFMQSVSSEVTTKKRGACRQVGKIKQLYHDSDSDTSKDYKAKMKMFCIEPVPANVQLLNHAHKQSGLSKDDFVIWPYAIANTSKPTTVQFIAAAVAGNEVGHIMDGRLDRASTVDVTLTSLDLLFGDSDETIDILSIDTEGHDPNVMFGAEKVLGKTRYLEFEVHRDIAGSPWGKTSLKSVIDYLSKFNFICFWTGNQGQLVKITDCWHQSYEKYARRWRNAACVKQNDPWYSIMSKIHQKQTNVTSCVIRNLVEH